MSLIENVKLAGKYVITEFSILFVLAHCLQIYLCTLHAEEHRPAYQALWGAQQTHKGIIGYDFNFPGKHSDICLTSHKLLG